MKSTDNNYDADVAVFELFVTAGHQIIAQDVHLTRRAAVLSAQHHVDILRVNTRQPFKYLLSNSQTQSKNMIEIRSDILQYRISMLHVY